MTLTCISCRTTFSNSEEQRNHYKSEFHRFNLKRKVAGLPPVTNQAFEEKLSAVRESDSQTKIQFDTYCPYCEKTYRTQKAFDQHCNSKKHLENKASFPDSEAEPIRKERIISQPTSEKESTDEDQDDEQEIDEEELIEKHLKKGVKLALEQCIFCNLMHETFEDALEHMTKEHGLFIPDLEFVSNLTGLITYLSRKVSFGLTCLYCKSGKVYSRVGAVQAHMRDLCHCKIRYETEDEQEEYDDFYDYSPSHSDEQSSGTSIETYQKMQENQFQVDDLNPFNLTLPNGKVIGHRNLALYYKQKPRPNESREPIVLSRLLTHYDQMGWTNKSDTQQLIQKQERQIQRRKNKSYEKLGIKANKLQHYFRQANP